MMAVAYVALNLANHLVEAIMRRIVCCSTAFAIFISTAAPALRAAESDYKITPDVVYGHKAGMALTFDVIRPKDPNGAGVLFMMSGAWISTWVPPEGFVSDKASKGFKHFRDLVDHGYTL